MNYCEVTIASTEDVEKRITKDYKDVEILISTCGAMDNTYSGTFFLWRNKNIMEKSSNYKYKSRTLCIHAAFDGLKLWC